MTGTVIKSTGTNYEIWSEGKIFSGRIRGRFRLKGIDTTNPVVVGDNVKLEVDAQEGSGWITDVFPRKNYIIRKSKNLSKQAHILASNLDLAMVVVTPVYPRTSTGFIDRFLATAEAYSIKAGLIFNKSDLYDSEVNCYADRLIELYQLVGYRCFKVTAFDQTTLTELKEFLKGKITLFGGHSGVGKSTIINTLIPGMNLKTAVLSEQHLKGKHTTTFAQMYCLPGGGFITDTPGIREFGTLEFNPKEVSHFFPEIFAFGKDCYFSDCTHTHEAGCAVIPLINKIIAGSRYDSYLSIFRNEDHFR
ncbi:MAG: ribosome small subunit-dependent GTPase A [Bacteroidia bacterium]|nr:ribosome small subunit-dependent GTPase A [Bacteroidia bacterium]MCZ2276570.1 ribosome small subunit-dependent GTPase A [Bacteroidia bacterium]